MKIYLPRLVDFAVFIQLHQTQVELYNQYHKIINGDVNHNKKNFFGDFTALQYICTHPHLLNLNEKGGKRPEQDLIVDEKENSPATAKGPSYMADGWWKKLLPEDVAEKVEYGTKMRVLKGIIEECEAINDKL